MRFLGGFLAYGWYLDLAAQASGGYRKEAAFADLAPQIR